jgi:thiol-disulfide isomerase/thioredoxin
MNRVYLKLYLLLILFLPISGYAEIKSATAVALPEFFEEIKTPIKLTSTSLFYNQKMEKTSLENFDNRFLIVHFWASWCMDCNLELVALNNLQKEFRKKALQVIAISEDYKGIEAVDAYFTKYKIDYLDIFLDKKGKIYQGLMLNHLPVSYLIDFNGKVVARSIPGKVIDWNDQMMKDYLEDKVSQYQLLPPEFKKIREKYEAPKETNNKNSKNNKKNKLFIN